MVRVLKLFKMSSGRCSEGVAWFLIFFISFTEVILKWNVGPSGKLINSAPSSQG